MKTQAKCSEAATGQMMSDETQRVAAMLEASRLPWCELVDTCDRQRESAGDRNRATKGVGVHCTPSDNQAGQVGGYSEECPDEKITGGKSKR